MPCACAEEICRSGSISKNHQLTNLNKCGKFHACIRNSTILALSRIAKTKCDQRIADIFTKGSQNRNISIVYLTQNVFPQGQACRDIALNTQWLVLFNNPIDRQQVSTLARRIYRSTSAAFMRKFEDATARPYVYLVIDLKSGTSEQDRLQTDIFVKQQAPDEENLSDDEDAISVGSLDYIRSISPPG